MEHILEQKNGYEGYVRRLWAVPSDHDGTADGIDVDMHCFCSDRPG